MERFKTPLVDTPVAALGVPSALPVDSDALPKDSKDCRVEIFAKHAFQTSLEALRAAIATSLSSRAMMIWTR